MVNGEIFDSEGICCSHGGGKSKNNGNVGISIRFQTVTNYIFIDYHMVPFLFQYMNHINANVMFNGCSSSYMVGHQLLFYNFGSPQWPIHCILGPFSSNLKFLSSNMVLLIKLFCLIFVVSHDIHNKCQGHS